MDAVAVIAVAEEGHAQRKEQLHRMPIPFALQPVYELSHGDVKCSAHEGTGNSQCVDWLATKVRDRVFDQVELDGLDDELQALQADGFGVDVLQKYIDAPLPTSTIGDIGEGIADLFLMERFSAHLPTNRRRDLRSEQGSLPGADIVGFAQDESGEMRFLFGEVKASSQKIWPPSVMAGNDGLAAQLERLANKITKRRVLLLYLRSRLMTAEMKAMYKSALVGLAEEKYKLVGVLVRDTDANKKDVDSPATSLSKKLIGGRSASIFVLHLGVDAQSWPQHCSPPK